MRSLFTALCVLALSGCSITPYVGISLHSEGADAPEFYAPNPIGIIGLEKKIGRFSLFCEHRSSIPYLEEGYGLNECGAKVHFE